MTAIVDLTGNPVDVCELSLDDLAAHVLTADPILDDWRNAPVLLRGKPLQNLIVQLTASYLSPTEKLSGTESVTGIRAATSVG
jgi:hypothetical protein